MVSICTYIIINHHCLHNIILLIQYWSHRNHIVAGMENWTYTHTHSYILTFVSPFFFFKWNPLFTDMDTRRYCNGQTVGSLFVHIAYFSIIIVEHNFSYLLVIQFLYYRIKFHLNWLFLTCVTAVSIIHTYQDCRLK